MLFADVQRAAMTLSPEEQRRLMGFLAGLQIQREQGIELRERFAEKKSTSWVPADGVKKRRPKRSHGIVPTLLP